MNAAALVLIHDDPILQRLLVTWPQCHDHEPSTARSYGPTKPVRLKYVLHLVQPKFELWAQISGIDVAIIEDRAGVLFGNGICLLDGTTASEALSMLAAKMLKATLGKRVPQPRTETTGG